MRQSLNLNRRNAIAGAPIALGLRNPMLHRGRAAVMARRWRVR